IEACFIQAPEHRPNSSNSISSPQNIPLIDLSPIHRQTPPPPGSLSNLISEIGEACERWGFFQVINHGVPEEPRKKILEASREFFALPRQEKMEVSRNGEDPFGYYDSEHTKNVRDWKQVFDFAVEDPILMPVSHQEDDPRVMELFNKWPQSLPHFRNACEEHTKRMEKLGFTLLELICLSLGLPKDRLRHHFKDQTSRVRLNYYPPCPAPELALGVGRHKDTGVLTVLTQAGWMKDEVAGLEVKRKSDGEWVLVHPSPNSLIINVGDIIQVWSNDRYESVEHRVVVNSSAERFSVPYFLYPAHYTWVEPLPELVTDQSPARFRRYNWGKFRATRNQGNFQKLHVENIQISHFR
ncbi:hypothetical protein M569_07084, partial [Genlisea aurea]